MFPRAVNVMTIERVDIPHGIELAHCRRFDAKTTSSAKRFFRCRRWNLFRLTHSDCRAEASHVYQ